jgi:hypothetical protein
MKGKRWAIRPATNATSRDSRSSLATTLHFAAFAAASAAASWGRLSMASDDELWNELLPAEQARIVELLVQRIYLKPDELDLTLRIEGLTSLYSEMRGQPAFQQAAG